MFNNKKIGQACIEFELLGGTMINSTEWVPSADHQQRFKNLYQSLYKDVSVLVELDNTILFRGNLENPIKLLHWFDDSPTETNHCFQITISGLQQNHHSYVDTVGDVATMVKVNSVRIENLSMRRVIEDFGQYCCVGINDPQVPGEFCGQDGVYKLEFKTPIYQWLLETEKNWDYYHDNFVEVQQRS